jgi:hypothetical protein
MRDDFAVFILTHGRPDNIKTLRALELSGYTGKTYLVIDDLDKSAPDYFRRYGDQVLQFSKPAIEPTLDLFDQGGDHRTITYARNACWDLAARVGVRYFIELDDDYGWFGYRTVGRRSPDQDKPDVHGWQVRDLDACWERMVDFLDESGALTVAMSQGGDHMGGELGWFPQLKRKAMNSFICDVKRPFRWIGRMNEDVNTYTSGSRRGLLFFTYTPLQLNQTETQSQEGGITELYVEHGTYQKAFSTVMACPSAVVVGQMGRQNKRLHHKINWNACAPKIVREQLRRTSA